MKKISKCRLCKSSNFKSVLDLGQQHLTGVFPKSPTSDITIGPLSLVWCNECNLLQLEHSFDPNEMYGDNYGYRSGLNRMMIEHLSSKVELLCKQFSVSAGDSVLDIGSNDATLLKSYKIKGLKKTGIDPTAGKFSEFYTSDIRLIDNFFTASNVGKEKFKIITAISMFYDLEDPLSFVRDISSVLAKDGVWHFEQSYMPSMLRMNSYDTICHEHIEYYSLTPVKIILEKCGLRIIDVKMNAVNGGSFAVTACHENALFPSNEPLIDWLLEQERSMGVNSLTPFVDFKKKVFQHKHDLKDLLIKLKHAGKVVHGYGASTKGNVLLQFCDITPNEIPFISEINTEKFGHFTPGTNIPIISDKESKGMNPDYYLVLPWHFKSGILKNEKEFLKHGGSLILPFPEIEII
jgi:cyclopropane fatty-acyl-phospholipid synthase-like methyltransferase